MWCIVNKKTWLVWSSRSRQARSRGPAAKVERLLRFGVGPALDFGLAIAFRQLVQTHERQVEVDTGRDPLHGAAVAGGERGPECLVPRDDFPQALPQHIRPAIAP